jgi:hypothetical protein
MNMDLGKQLQQLTRRQQARLWLKRISRRMPALIGWSASVLFLGGSLHQLVLPLNPLAVACIAMLPSVLMLSWIIATEKPTTDEAAAAADNLLDANSLFVSAWELGRSGTAQKGIGQLLLARAEIALPEWRQRDKSKPQHYLKPAGLTAVSLGFVGLLFLLLPPHVHTEQSPAAEPSVQTEILTQANDIVHDTAMDLSDLFVEDSNKAAISQDQHVESGNQPEFSVAVAPPSPNVSDQTTASETSESMLQPDGQLSSTRGPQDSTPQLILQGLSTNDATRVSGQTPGNDAATSSDTAISKANAFDQINRVDIETGTDTLTKAFDGSRDGTGLIAYRPEQPVIGQPTNRHPRKLPQTVSATQLTAEQRSLVRRYFKQLENINEANE